MSGYRRIGGSSAVHVDELATAIMKELDDYSLATTEGVKKAVREAGKTAVEDIEQAAPRRTGKYAKSWKARVMQEYATSLQIVVHSPGRYRIAHLLEHGHAKRGGGRVTGRVHIAPAEEHAMQQLEEDIRKVAEGGSV